jgi:hypothetical protein
LGAQASITQGLAEDVPRMKSAGSWDGEAIVAAQRCFLVQEAARRLETSSQFHIRQQRESLCSV